MDKQDTIIVVATTELDGYGNLWVTPQGGGDRIKVAQKRKSLHHLFEQGKAVMLHWEIYLNKPYVADAKLVEGELPPARKPVTPETGDIPSSPPAPQEVGLWWKEMGKRIGDGSLERDFPKMFVKIKTVYYKKMSEVTRVPFWAQQEEKET